MFASNIANSTNYYVNDNSTSGDVFGCGVGSNTTGNGTKATPYATFNKLWSVKSALIMAGDSIYIDAGTYISYAGGDGFGGNHTYTLQKAIIIQGAGNIKTIFDNNFIVSKPFAYITAQGAGIKINDIQFKNYSNNATSEGQCISISGLTTATPIILTNVIITSCHTTTTGNGGTAPIFFYHAQGTTVELKLIGCALYCNGDATHNGGGIDIYGNHASAYVKLNLYNCAFIGNRKFNPQLPGGAAISVKSGSIFITDSITITNCLFDGNTLSYATTPGGSSIYIPTMTGTPLVKITNSVFKNGSITGASANTYGGVCHFYQGTVTISGCSFESNTFSTGTVKGALASNTATITLFNSYFSGNTANTASDIHLNSTGTINVTNSTFSSSGTNLNKSAGTFTITNCGSPGITGTITNNVGTPTAFSTPTVPSYTGSCSSSNVSLPVELLYFNANKNNNQVFLHWATSSETNSDFYLIERSSDLINFEQIATIKAAGFSNQLLNYFDTDENPIIGTNYYRLTQFDFDGKNYVYPPIAVNFIKTEYSFAFNFALYPNPADNKTFYIQHEEIDKPISFQIYNQLGLLVYSSNLINDFSTKVELPSDFKAGIYFVRINANSKKIIVN